MTIPTSERKPAMSTIALHDVQWRDQVDIHNYASRSPGRPRTLRALWRATRGHDRVVLMGAVSARHWYQDIVLAVLLKARRPRPHVLITDATWEPGSRAMSHRFPRLAPLVPPLVRGVVHALDGAYVTYGVLSSDEETAFADTWGVDADRVTFTPYFATLDAATPTTRGDYVFAGGNSLRDYQPLVDAMDGTGIPLTVATTWQPAQTPEEAEISPVPHDRFVDLLAGSAAVVVPLERSVRSAGQQSYLNAMLLEKPVIVTDAPGVRDYITDGVTGVIVPPQPAALRAAIEHVMDPANAEHYARMTARAREDVLDRFSVHAYAKSLLAAVDLPAAA